MNNYVKKHMDQIHRPATHVDRKRSQLLADEAACQEGLLELEEGLEDSSINNNFSSTFNYND